MEEYCAGYEAAIRHLARTGSSLADLAADIRGWTYDVYAIRRLGLASPDLSSTAPPLSRNRGWMRSPSHPVIKVPAAMTITPTVCASTA